MKVINNRKNIINKKKNTTAFWSGRFIRNFTSLFNINTKWKSNKIWCAC